MAGRILIADPTATNRIILRVRLEQARYETRQAADGASVLEAARTERPDLVILSAQLPDISAAELCTRLKATPHARHVPVLVLDAHGARRDRLAMLRAGADDVLVKPVSEQTLLAIVRHLMRTRATFDELARRRGAVEELGFAEAGAGFSRAARIAVVAPAPETGLSWRRDLGQRLEARFTQLARAQALDPAPLGETPDAFIIAADLAAQGDGLRLVSELRARRATRHAVIVIQDEGGAPETIPMALDLGADAVVPGRFDADELAARLGTLISRKREAEELRESVTHQLVLAIRDPLTGLYNRRYAEAYLSRIAGEAARTGQPFAVMMLDLDRFKDVNDTYGHRVGDDVLVETAHRLLANLREIDLVARHGGEEFLVAMPETGLAAARTAAERLRRVIAEAPMRSASQGAEVTVTVSIGVTVWDGSQVACELSALIDKADVALYASKTEGRNQVTLSGDAAA